MELTREWMLDLLERAPPNIIRNYRKIVAAASISDASVEQSYDLERELFIQTWGNENHMTAIEEVFKEKALRDEQIAANSQRQKAEFEEKRSKELKKDSTQPAQESVVT